jgi:2-methylcitrate dehydratase PrpD
LTAIILAGRAGKAEFTDEFVSAAACQDMQHRIETQFDQGIEDMGWDRIRSRLEVLTKDGRTITRWANENYRGSPHYPLTDTELEGKFRDCAEGLMNEAQMQALFAAVWSIETAPDAGHLFDLLAWRG